MTNDDIMIRARGINQTGSQIFIWNNRFVSTVANLSLTNVCTAGSEELKVVDAHQLRSFLSLRMVNCNEPYI